MPAVFAIADKVIANIQTATFAAFGSFAMLVLAEFTGRPRSRLTAYLTLGLVGARPGPPVHRRDGLSWPPTASGAPG
jgi:hypothetical protein